MSEKTRWKCNLNCVGDIPKECVTTKIAWVSKNIINTEGKTKKPIENSLNVTPLLVLALCQTILGGDGVKGLSYTRHTKAEKHEE